MASMSGVLDRLVGQGVAVRTGDSRDGRVRRIEATPLVRVVIGRLVASRPEFDEEVLTKLRLEDLRALEQGMRAVSIEIVLARRASPSMISCGIWPWLSATSCCNGSPRTGVTAVSSNEPPRPRTSQMRAPPSRWSSQSPIVVEPVKAPCEAMSLLFQHRRYETARLAIEQRTPRRRLLPVVGAGLDCHPTRSCGEVVTARGGASTQAEDDRIRFPEAPLLRGRRGSDRSSQLILTD